MRTSLVRAHGVMHVLMSCLNPLDGIESDLLRHLVASMELG